MIAYYYYLGYLLYRWCYKTLLHVNIFKCITVVFKNCTHKFTDHLRIGTHDIVFNDNGKDFFLYYILYNIRLYNKQEFMIL